jgi:hypothetical protein
MIENIENTDKYLYQGRIVDLAFLQARKAELEGMISANQKQIDSIKLINCSELEGDLKEAACMFNEKSNAQKSLIIELNENLNDELQLIETCL